MSLDSSHKIPGTEFVNPQIVKDAPPNTDPIILSDRAKAGQLAVKEYLNESEETSLKLLCDVSTTINRLNGKITDIITQVNDLDEEKKRLEYRLHKLGVAMEKVGEAGMVAGREYVHTEERERQD